MKFLSEFVSSFESKFIFLSQIVGVASVICREKNFSRERLLRSDVIMTQNTEFISGKIFISVEFRHFILYNENIPISKKEDIHEIYPFV